MTLTRRQLLFASGAALLGPDVLGQALAADEKGPTKKVLFFTKSSGFQHSVITRKNNQPSLAERLLTDLGKEHGFEVVCSKDGRLFDPDQIGQWDAFVFETTGDLTTQGGQKEGEGAYPMSKEGKQAFLDAIRGGKGFVGIHCATDTFHSRGTAIDPYIEMIGAEFIVHGAQQKARIDIVDPNFPGVRPFGTDSFEILDEWYALKNFQDDLHVILVQNTENMDKKGNNKCYDRPNFPETWARMHGKGRVFYTSMGHREDVWENPKFQGLLVGALTWATGRAEADITPNVSKVTPGYKQVAQR
ncbi:MAG: ThuA domain-containing protein [Isosphaeraceae bacterium]|nr:ThuA domain-containing protein [Isosphaeraceae bacterium]